VTDSPDARYTDLPASAFPFTLELLDAKTRKVRWSTTVPGPGVVKVPSKDEINGGRAVIARVSFADGEVREA
jgi:hypothetical protein